MSRGPFPGPWRNSNGPALAGIMDLCRRRGIQWIVIRKANQVGGSEIFRNVLAYYAHVDPCPALIVLPNENDGKKIFSKNLLPLFTREVEVLKGLDTGQKRDKKLNQITLNNGFELTLGYSGSASSLASDPYRIVILDEVDKYEAFSGAEGSPVDLARVRTKKFGDRALIILISTPTSPAGTIEVEFEASPIKLYCFVPCPHCGTFQQLTFGQLRWEKFKDLPDAASRAERIKRRRAAWVECASAHCKKKIEEHHKREILPRAYWGTKDGAWKLHPDGREEGQKPEGSRVGVHYPAFYDLSYRFSDIAAEFVAADGRLDKLVTFHNSTLGEAFHDSVKSITIDVLAAKCRPDEEKGYIPPKARTVPAWASRLLMLVDTQLDYFYYVIRAWGPNLRSQRVDHGQVTSFEQLEDLQYLASWPYEGNQFPALRVHLCGIDSGGGLDRDYADATRTDQVYQWCLRDNLRRIPLKGSSGLLEYPHFRKKEVDYVPRNQKRSPYKVGLHFIDPVYWRDLLAGYIGAKIPVLDPETGEIQRELEQWMLNDADDPDYNRHLSVMEKIRIRSGRKHVERWRPKSSGARHDYHDLESYQLALAHGPGRCFALPSPEQFAKQAQEERQTASRGPGGVRAPDGRSFFATKR